MKDMTSGNPSRIVLNFTIPIFVGNIFQQLYSMVDTVIVGKFVGNEALAAVGACGTLMFLILGFLLGLTAGFTVITAHHYGAGNLRAVRQSVASASLLSAVISVVLTVVSMLLMKDILHWMNTPPDMFRQAYEYIMVICGGIVAQVLYNLLASILRAVGDSKRPLYFLIFAAFLNVVLDLVFIIIFHMGAAGAAWATVISQGISGLLCLLYIVGRVPELHLKKEDWAINWSLAKHQMRIGFPMAFQYSITAIGTIIVQTALNSLGSVAAAGFAAASKIEQIVTQAYIALGTTMATYCAQNMGARKTERVRKGFRAAVGMGTVYAVATGVLVAFGGKYVTPLFVSSNIDVIMGYVDTYLKCAGIFFIPLMIVNVYRNGIQGMGYGILPMTAGIAELAGRSGAAAVGTYLGSFTGICLANPTAWVLAGALLLGMYAWIMKRQGKQELMESKEKQGRMQEE